jgi:soluble lytic murein transglycosylase-like protein
LSRRGTCLGTIAFVLLCCAADVVAKDGFLYYEEGGRIVITNTPSRREAQPLPGFESAGLPQPSSIPSSPWDDYIERIAPRYGLSPDLVRAVAWVESRFDPRAVSSAGAVGVMQLMPATAAEYGVNDLRDPYENLRAGTAHLSGLLDEFDGDLTLALAAYNAGSGAVRRYGGVPAYRETRNYVMRVRGTLENRPRKAPPPRIETKKIEVRRNPDGTIVASN